MLANGDFNENNITVYGACGGKYTLHDWSRKHADRAVDTEVQEQHIGAERLRVDLPPLDDL